MLFCQQWWLPNLPNLPNFFNKGGCQLLLFFNNGGWSKSMLGCCTLNGNTPNNHPLWHLYGQLSFCFFSTILHPAALPSLPFRERFRPSLQVLAKPFNHQSHQRITSTRWFHTSHLKSVNACLWEHSPSSVSIMLGPEWFIKPYIKAYNTPSNWYSQVRQSLSILMWSRAHHSSKSLLIQELRLPSVPP